MYKIHEKKLRLHKTCCTINTYVPTQVCVVTVICLTPVFTYYFLVCY